MRQISLFALAAGIAGTGLAHAENTEAHETIVVTGTRAVLEAERLPLRVDVLDRERIELEGITSLNEALERFPGLSVVQSGGLGATSSIFTRGTNAKHTLVLFDGIRVNDASTPAGQFDAGQDILGDIERIEIARGPLSALYGSDAIGGVINLIPRQGGEEAFSPWLDISAGSFNTFRLLAGASGTIDRFSYGLSAERYQTDGFNVTPARMALSGNERDGGEATTLTFTGAYDLTNGFTLTGLFRHRESASEFDTFSGGPGFNQRADDPGLELPRNDQTVWRTGLDWQRADGGFASTLRFGEVINDRESANAGVVTDVYSARRQFAEWLNDWRPAVEGLHEAVLSLGLQTERDSIRNDTAFENPISRAERHYGAYVTGTAGLDEAFDVTASARIDDFDGFGTETTWAVGGVFTLPGTAAQLFARYGTAFKAPPLSERFASSAFTTPNPDLQPETAESWEIGARSAFDLGEGNVATLSLSYFETEIDNLIENVFDFTTSTGSNQNVGRADISGWELAGTLSLGATLQLDADYANVDAVNAVTGAQLLRRPRHAWSAGARWTPVDALSLAVRYQRTGSRRDVTYDDDGFFVSGNAPVAGYDLVHVSGQWRFHEAVTAYATVTNALDKTYEQPAAFAGAPRALMVGVRARY
ncbi:MAG: TonB-dependent receptor [Oceanicaulis sp.]|nr:TonB-dependent receptor [Oceanicaulis sp.]